MFCKKNEQFRDDYVILKENSMKLPLS